MARRNTRLVVKLWRAEHDRLQAMAKQQGISMSALVRARIFGTWQIEDEGCEKSERTKSHAQD